MKARNVYRSNKPEPVGLEAALRGSLDRTFSEGELERIRERLDTHDKMMAQLVRMLSDNGKLQPEQVAEFLQWPFEVAEE